MKYLAFKLDGVYPPWGCRSDLLLDRFSLLSLESVRQYNSCLFVFKLVNGLVDCPELLLQLNFSVPRSNSRAENNNCFYLPKARTNIMVKSPMFTVCKDYNSVDTHLEIYSSKISIFKTDLKRLLLDRCEDN